MGIFILNFKKKNNKKAAKQNKTQPQHANS